MTRTLNRAFKFRLYPTLDQAPQLGQIIGVCRLVYNLGLEQRRDFYRQYQRQEGRPISLASQCRELTQLRGEVDWIGAGSSAAQIYALRDLDQAFSNFFAGRAKYPTPRKKGLHASFRLKGRETRVRQLNAKWSEVQIPNLGFMKFRRTREALGRVLNLTVSNRAGAWFLVLVCEYEAQAVEALTEIVGIDRGIAQTLTLSTGEHLQMPSIAALTKRRGKAQRVLARRKRGSKRYAAQRARVATLRAKESRIRTDWCHQASTDIARRFGVVAIEDLKIANMTASASKNVSQKAGLNRSILEQGWGRFATLLDYKLTERGGVMISVPPHYTSQTCSACGVVDARSRESQAVFNCVHCDHTANADVNAAVEIERRGTAFLDVDGGGGRRSKRQPKETAHA